MFTLLGIKETQIRTMSCNFSKNRLLYFFFLFLFLMIMLNFEKNLVKGFSLLARGTPNGYNLLVAMCRSGGEKGLYSCYGLKVM